MDKFNNIDEVLSFAIESEQKAVDFYTSLAENAKGEMKQVFIDFAKEEMGHKNRLQHIKTSGEMNLQSTQCIQDLKIADYTVKAEISENMTYQDALVLAMKREKAAFKLYTKLASLCTNEIVRLLFLSLAQEESKHKLRFEIEYDEYVLMEN